VVKYRYAKAAIPKLAKIAKIIRIHLIMGCFERFLRFFFLVDFGPLLRCEVGAFFVDFVDFADFAGFALAELLLEFDVGLELFFVDFPISLVPQFLGLSDEVFLVFDGMNSTLTLLYMSWNRTCVNSTRFVLLKSLR
jgi:hypothetical protein